MKHTKRVEAKPKNVVACDASGRTVELVLYKFDACPYCRRVMGAVDRLGIPVRYRDTNEHPEAWRELLEIGGKEQVPCLFVNGSPMYESEEIVDYLERQIRIEP